MYYICLHVQSHLCNPWTVACQASLSVEFSRQEYWSGQAIPSLRDLPDPGIKPRAPALQVDSLLPVEDTLNLLSISLHNIQYHLSSRSHHFLHILSGSLCNQFLSTQSYPLQPVFYSFVGTTFLKLRNDCARILNKASEWLFIILKITVLYPHMESHLP